MEALQPEGGAAVEWKLQDEARCRPLGADQRPPAQQTEKRGLRGDFLQQNSEQTTEVQKRPSLLPWLETITSRWAPKYTVLRTYA